MERRELISVIVPVYNAGRWLRPALESLRSQTYEEFEAILVDDGSTDGSAEICREYCEADSRFRLISQPNEGVSAARNHGIDLAEGDRIAFMDADDILPAYALSTMADLAQRSGSMIVAGGFLRTAEPEKHISAEHGGASGADSFSVLPSDEAIRIGLYQQRILNNPWGMLFHTSIFKGERPLRFRKCRYEDLDLFYQAFERTDTVCVTDAALYLYRDAPGSFINTWSDARLDVLDVTDRIVEHMKGRSPQLLKAALDRRFSAHFNMLTEMLRHKVDNPRQMRRCLDVIKSQRRHELLDPDVRLKNKLGALLSYLGLPAIRMICEF